MKQFNFMIMLVPGRVQTLYVRKNVTVDLITERCDDEYKNKFLGGCVVTYDVDNQVPLYENGEEGFGEGDDGVLVAFADTLSDTWKIFSEQLDEDADVDLLSEVLDKIQEGGEADL